MPDCKDRQFRKAGLGPRMPVNRRLLMWSFVGEPGVHLEIRVASPGHRWPEYVHTSHRTRFGVLVELSRLRYWREYWDRGRASRGVMMSRDCSDFSLANVIALRGGLVVGGEWGVSA